MNHKKKGVVVWLDEEPSLVAAEVYDLEWLGYETKAFQFADEALDYLLTLDPDSEGVVAIIIDVLMPSFEDPRLKTDDGSPVSVAICRNLIRAGVWNSVKGLVTFYTRLPDGPVLRIAGAFAKEHELPLYRKSGVSRIALELIKDKRIGNNS